MDPLRLILSTFPDLESARQIGTLALENQAIACVNLIPGIESVYRWQGKIETTAEILAVFKTTRTATKNFADWLATVHPYDTPEIAILAPEEVDPRYARWLNQCVPASDSVMKVRSAAG